MIVIYWHIAILCLFWKKLIFANDQAISQKGVYFKKWSKLNPKKINSIQWRCQKLVLGVQIYIFA